MAAGGPESGGYPSVSEPRVSWGLGIVMVAHFDEPVADRAAAERRLTVTSSGSRLVVLGR